MSEKKTVKLSDICILEKGQQIDTSLLDDSKPYRYINGGIKESGYFDNFNTSGESVLISEGGASCGYINYVNEDFWCGCHCYRLHDIKVFPKYLFHALKANQQRIMALRTGSAMPNIQKSTIQKFELKIHDDLKIQQNISSMLDKCNVLIEKHKLILDKYDTLIKSRFIEMFSNQKDCFPCCTLEDVSSKIFAGGDRPKDTSETKNDEYKYPVFANAETKKGLLCFSKNFQVEVSCVTIAARGCTVGYTEVRNEKFTPVVRLLTIIPTKSITPLFLKFFLDLEIKIEGNGAAQPQLTVPTVRKYKIYVPPIELQNDFASFVQQIDKSKFAVQKSLEKAETLYKSLMQEYFG